MPISGAIWWRCERRRFLRVIRRQRGGRERGKSVAKKRASCVPELLTGDAALEQAQTVARAARDGMVKG
jgi:hypothetical protein